MRQIFLAIVAIAAVLTSCSDNERVYKIGVSQCSQGRWREKVNSEMLAAQHLYESNVKVNIIDSYDDTELQIKQIDSLANSGIDLLVVAPNEAGPIAEAVSRARQKGIPVVFFDRKANVEDYTAFIGGNNVEAGKTVADYALSLPRETDERIKVLEVTGTMTTSPAQERHKGFEKVMKAHSEVDYACINGSWSTEDTYNVVKQQIASGQIPAVIFCHSDFMANGAYNAVKEAGLADKIKILGIDGMVDEGVEYVQKGYLAGSYIYPTHGEKIVRLALDILTGQPYERDNYLPSMMVTPENARIVAMNSLELMNQNKNLVVIQGKLENFFGLYNTQRKILIVTIVSIVLLAIALVLFWRAVKQIKRAHRKMKLLNKEQTLFYTNASHQLKTPLTLIAGPVKELLDSNSLKGEKQQLLEIVSRNVNQLENLISDVLNFRREVAQTVSDETAITAIQQASSKEVLQESRLTMMKQEDSEELSTILVIDDNDDMRRYLRTLLADKFYVLEAADGQSGLKLARESVPDLVVSDVMMPVMDGLQLCKQLKEDPITSHIPVILLTARSTEAQQMEGFEHGADAYLTKPFSADLLIVRIYNLLKSRQQLRSLFDGKEEQPVKLSTQDKLFIDTIKEAIKSNMQNADLRMDDLGEEIGLSRVQMYRKVKALTGLSPVELLREMRLQRGYTLLSGTTKTVAEVAYEVGFSKPSYFSSCFKTKYGKLPTEMRAQ